MKLRVFLRQGENQSTVASNIFNISLIQQIVKQNPQVRLICALSDDMCDIHYMGLQEIHRYGQRLKLSNDSHAYFKVC